MKNFSCYNCDESFQAETREQILDMLYEHYMKHHHSVIISATGEEKRAWMERFEKDWLIAPEVTK